jgi:hypothetical protein
MSFVGLDGVSAVGRRRGFSLGLPGAGRFVRAGGAFFGRLRRRAFFIRAMGLPVGDMRWSNRPNG